MTVYGYARVSTNGQDLGAQVAELKAAGCGNIYKEKASGAKTDRPELAKLIRRLEDGDVLTVLGGLAEFERSLIAARTDAGRKRAKARGVKFGRPHKLTSHQRRELMERLADGAVQGDLARSYGVSQATISRLAAPSPFAQSAADAP